MEKKYFTRERSRLNFLKQFKEEADDSKAELPYKSARYAKKKKLRQEVRDLTLEKFMTDAKFQNLDIWDLKYITTSEEEDNDSDIASDSEADEAEEVEEEAEEEEPFSQENADKKQLDKFFEKSSKEVPTMFKKIKRTSRRVTGKRSVVTYQVQYTEDGASSKKLIV